ncbi:MAG TPA: DUF362 domain-containing protein [Spirochaetota bacterium]|nr:DUF362 domain-containing protein [Spirochaetota bacterium]
MKSGATVFLSDTAQGIPGAVCECFDTFGGARKLLKSSGDIYLKVNAVDLKKYCYTDPEVVRETIRYFRRGGAKNIYVIENCTQANFTRLVFKGTGLDRICREEGAVPVYLDEMDVLPVYLEELQSFIEVPRLVAERLIRDRDKNLYVSLPKLKTHSMSQVTLSIKNQFGLVDQESRIADHNFRIHQKFADIYRVLRPDFVLVDGIIATNHGHYIAEGNADKCVVPMGLLISGNDPMAVDTVGAALIGYSVKDVKHLALSAKTGIGESDIRKIRIINRQLFDERKKKLTHELLDDFPPDVKIVRGRERCCPEGCKRNTETVLEVMFRDHGGKGGFTILMGRGADAGEVAAISGRVHIAGGCAIQDWGLELQERLGRKNVTMSDGCNNLAMTIYGLCKQMKVNQLKLVPVNPVSSLAALVTARIRGTRAKITPLI